MRISKTHVWAALAVLAMAPGVAMAQRQGVSFPQTPIGTSAGTVAAGNDSRFANFSNLGGVADYAWGTGASIAAGGNTLSGGVTSCSVADTNKTVLIPGAATGGARLSAIITGCSGAAYTLGTNATLAVSPTTYQVQATGSIVQTDGTGCAAGDTIPIAGGTALVAASYTVLTCQVHSAAITAAGTGGTTGGCFLTGTTGTGEPFRVYGTVAGGVLTGVGVFIHRGDYTVNPTNLTAEPVTGCGLTGATLTLTMGVSQQVSPGSGVTPTTPGSYSAYPSSPVSQGTASGAEAGVSFDIYFLGLGSYGYGTNNYSAITAALNALDVAGGGTLQLACGGHYLVSGGSISLGDQGNLPGVTLQGCTNLTAGAAYGVNSGPSGAGLYFDPTAGAKINVFGYSQVKSLAVFNALVSWNPGTDTFRANQNRNALYQGTAVHFGNPNGGRGGAVKIEDSFIEGFASGIETKNNGNWIINRVKLDDLNGLNITSIPDFSWVKTMYCNTFGYNANVDPAKNAITALTNNGGLIQVTTLAAHPFEAGDRIAIQFAGSFPNQPVSGFPTANGTWTVAAVIDANNFTLANSTYPNGQTYTPLQTAYVYPYGVRQGECFYYNGSAAGNDGLYISDLQANNWLHGAHSYGGQGQHWYGVGAQANVTDPNAIGIWWDGAILGSEINGGEIQSAAIPLNDTTFGSNTAINRVTNMQLQPSGYGYIFNHQGSSLYSFSGLTYARGVSGYQSENIDLINLGDGDGQLTFGAGSDLYNVGFLAQSYADWAALTLTADISNGGSVTAIGATLPPAPLNTANGATGTNSLKNPLGSCDVAGSSSICLGLRRELSSYSGPLVNVRRASDSAAMDLPQDSFGNLDQGKCAAFQGSSTLSVTKWYEQHGTSAYNGIQTVAANQPTLVCSVPQLNGKPGILYGNGTTAFMQVLSGGWQGAFGSAIPGSVVLTVAPTSPATNNDRIFVINSGGGQNSLTLQMPNGSYQTQLVAGYSTSNGIFTPNGLMTTAAPNVIDYTYSWTATTNTPATDVNGSPSTITTTAPVGTAGTDTGLAMLFGGIGATATTFPGYVNTLVLVPAGPGAAALEQMRKAQGAYYGASIL